MSKIEPNIVRFGKGRIGYKVSAKEKERHQRFIWMVAFIALIPSTYTMVIYGQHGEPLLPISQFWWEFGFMTAVVMFVGCVSRIANYAYLKGLCRGKEPYDDGISFWELRRPMVLKNWPFLRWCYGILIGAVLFGAAIGELSGAMAFVGLVFGTTLLEAIFYRYLSSNSHHSPADITK